MSGESEKTSVQPVLPVKNTVLFPLQPMPLNVGRARSVAAVEAAVAREDKTLVVVVQNDPGVEEPELDGLFHVGTLAVIKRLQRSEDGIQILVQGLQRVRLVEPDTSEPSFLKARVTPIPSPTDAGPEVEALHREVLDTAGQIAALVEPQAQRALGQILQQAITEPLEQVYVLASMVGLDVEKEKSLLAAATRRELLERMHEFLSQELQVAQLRHKIASQTQTEMTKQQREYVLRQQLEAIQRELGEQTPEQAEAAELRQRITEVDLPEKVKKAAEKELARLERMSPNAPDYQVTRTYLDLVLDLPWNKTTEDVLDIGPARQILDEDHYNLQEVKERILEHLAVMRLNPQAHSPILCFVGPPGVGKTSLGQSIARALGRHFERMSLGGLHDEAELRGHRRTYIGAMPGRIIQAIRRTEVSNPLLMLDEVDKLGRDFRGDPAAALMEILDPAQNNEFRDNFVDLPFDLSKVFFITTANALESIPRPLLDRMEILRLAGYSDEEKRHIGRTYLIPRRLEQTGLESDQLTIPDETLRSVIRRYTREAGVRELERQLGTLCRKVAMRFVEGREEPLTVRPEDLAELLGPARFFEEDARKELVPGVAAGLAWTEVGGELLYIEAVRLAGNRELLLTGQLGNVMQESAKAARSLISTRADQLGIDPEKFESGLHIHVPAGATPKDGPSAGVTMATALASLYADLPVRADTAMTGEITLSGLVLPVGGIKEKVLAGHRASLRRIVLPKQNEKDLADLPEQVHDELEFVFVERIDEVLVAAIPNLNERMAVALSR